MDVLGEPIGVHDQYLAALGGMTCLAIDQDGTVQVSPLATCDGIVEELEASLLVFYTGVKRSASEVLGDESQAISHGQDGVTAALHTVKEIGWQVKEALETANLRCFGGLLDHHHRQPGVVGTALTTRGVVVEIIADGVHLAPTTVRLALAAKGVDEVLLVTDSRAATARSYCSSLVRCPLPLLCPLYSKGSITFLTALNRGNRLYDWKTKPILRLRTPANLSLLNRLTSSPSST